MIIEAAFFRFNEALIRNATNHYYFNEEQIRGLFGQSIIEELNSRNISYPSLMVNFQKKYGVSRALKKTLVADIHANFNKNTFNSSLLNYGYSSENWIEIKYLSSKSDAKSSKTANSALILKDILRLILLTGGKKSYQARYVLIVTDKEPEKYFATKIRGIGEREWLNLLLNNNLAKKDFCIQLTNESKFFKKKIGNCSFLANIHLLISSLSFVPCSNLTILNTMNVKPLLFYSYLFRIDDFLIEWNNKSIPDSNDQETYDNCRLLSKIIWGKDND